MGEFDVEYDCYNDIIGQEESSGESPIQQTPFRDGISKGHLLEKLIIPDSAFDQASRLNGNLGS